MLLTSGETRNYISVQKERSRLQDRSEAAGEDEGPSGPLPSLLTRQEGDMTSWVLLNGEFHTKLWTQLMSRAPESPPDQLGDEVSDLKSGMSDSESEGT